MMNPAVRSVKYANSGKKRFRRKETCSALGRMGRCPTLGAITGSG